MAKALFQIPEDLELFSMPELDQILHCARGKRNELIRAGEIEVITVAGKQMAKGRSVRGYIARCSNKPSGRSLCAKQLNAAGKGFPRRLGHELAGASANGRWKNTGSSDDARNPNEHQHEEPKQKEETDTMHKNIDIALAGRRRVPSKGFLLWLPQKTRPDPLPWIEPQTSLDDLTNAAL
jgi:hypothetical protein